MKKVSCLLSILILLFLSSCSTNSNVYQTQDGITFNYNNIGTSSGIWLTNESICYLEDMLWQNYYLVSDNKKERICSNNGYGFGRIQHYGDKIYMLDCCTYIDEQNSDYLLKYYDVEQKKVNDIITIRNCDEFFVLNNDIFYLRHYWLDDMQKLSLKMYSTNSNIHTSINDSVLSFGVIGNDVYYVTEKNSIISIFRYDKGNGSSVECGKFALETEDVESFREYVNISYTPKYVMFSLSGLQNNTSMIWKFTLEDSSVEKFDFDGNITTFISYNECSYFVAYDSNQDKENSTIYRLTNKTGETSKMGQFSGYCGLFVGSDYGVYVIERSKNRIVYCSEEEDYNIVYEF